MKKIFIITVAALISTSFLNAQSGTAQQEKKSIGTVTEKPLKDGKYTGTAKGYSGDITVEVEVLSSKIKNIKIVAQKEIRPKTALKKLPEEVIAKQSAENIDAVTGATYTSKGFLEAVKNALKNAQK